MTELALALLVTTAIFLGFIGIMGSMMSKGDKRYSSTKSRSPNKYRGTNSRDGSHTTCGTETWSGSKYGDLRTQESDQILHPLCNKIKEEDVVPLMEVEMEYSDRVSTASTNLVAYKALTESIAQVVIPSGARIVNPKGSDKFRTDKAYIAGFFTPDGMEIDYREFTGRSLYDGYRYRQGKMHSPEHSLNIDLDTACASGIHFFSSFPKAKKWFNRSKGLTTRRNTTASHSVRTKHAKAKRRRRRRSGSKN